jgi:hypothetical protein
MNEQEKIRYNAATAVFKLAVTTFNSGVHRTLNIKPKGQGWVQCEGKDSPHGLMCKPDKVRTSIEYFKIAYEIFPDIVALNQIAIAHEILGEADRAYESYQRMKVQAEVERNKTYSEAADHGMRNNQRKL